MKTKRINSIDEISKIVAPIALDFGVRKLYVFGSYARDVVTTNSLFDDVRQRIEQEELIV